MIYCLLQIIVDDGLQGGKRVRVMNGRLKMERGNINTDGITNTILTRLSYLLSEYISRQYNWSPHSFLSSSFLSSIPSSPIKRMLIDDKSEKKGEHQLITPHISTDVFPSFSVSFSSLTWSSISNSHSDWVDPMRIDKKWGEEEMKEEGDLC